MADVLGGLQRFLAGRVLCRHPAVVDSTLLVPEGESLPTSLGLPHSFIHSFIHSLIHSLTHSFTREFIPLST